MDCAHRPEFAAAALALVLAMLPALPAFAAGPEIGAARDRLKQLEQAVEAGREQERRLADEAASLAAELEALRQQLMQAVASAQQQEEKLAALELRLTELNAEEFLRQDMLEMRRKELAGILGALTRLARHPPVAMVAAPEAPIDVLRSARLLAAVAPSLKAGAKALKTELEGLEALRNAIIEETRLIGEASSRLEAEEQTIRRLAGQVAEKRERLSAERQETKAQVAALAAEAKTVQALLRRLEELEAERIAEARRLDARRQEAARLQPAVEQNKPDAGKTADEPMVVAAIGVPPLPFTAARGFLAMPARGRLVEQFGEANGFGQTSKGITIATRANTQIVAPHDGRIVFAGEFRDYGQLLIIDPGEGYHILLAGMSQLYAIVGQSVLAGEPVGQMGTGPDKDPALYVELRQKGKAINPLPWMAADNRKVSG